MSLITIFFLSSGAAKAQQTREPPPRDVAFEWDASQRYLFLSMKYRDAVDEKIQRKLTRGLPTTIVMTAGIYRIGITELVSTTAQTCKVTWHVWEELYRVEITRPGGSQPAQWTTTVEGVLRRCGEARRLLAGDRNQIPLGAPLYVRAVVQVNPVSPELLKKIKRWVSRPTGTGTAAPGDALFSTFTGLFLQRVGDAERELVFRTKAAVPRLYKKE